MSPKLPPGTRRPTAAEMKQLAAEPSLTSNFGPLIGGYLIIGYRSIPLTVAERDALWPTASSHNRQEET